MGVEGVVLLVAPEGGGGGMRRSPPPPPNYDLYGEGMVDVVAVSVAGGAFCLGFEYVQAFPLVSLPSLEWRSLSAREVNANLAVPIGTMTLCKCRRKRRFVLYAFL